MSRQVSVPQRPPRSRWIHGLLCGAFLAWLPGYSLLVGVILAPSLLVYLLDSSRGEETSRVMLPYAFAVLVHPFHLLWMEDGSLNAAISILMNPFTSIYGWGAAATGWFMLELSLVGGRLMRQLKIKRLQGKLARELKDLQDEWDGDPNETIHLEIPAAAPEI